MSQLLFFLKSPHVKSRKKFILSVERILRSQGYSIFEKDQTARCLDLAPAFNIVEKRTYQASVGLKREELAHRSTWHGLQVEEIL